MLRTLAWFWGPVLLVLGIGAGVLQVLGPPPPRVVAAAPPPAAPAPPPRPRPAAFVPPKPGAPIAAPDPALLEPSRDAADAGLPRIGFDGRLPMQVYAAGYDAANPRPRVALLLADIGMRGADSEDAIRQMPPQVSLAISPYAIHPEALLADARASGHEMLISVPMEPESYPLNDPGNQALLTGAPPAETLQRLDWALSRIAGYVGATNALGPLRGERFAASGQMPPVLEELGKRGLLFIDASGRRVPDQAPAKTARRAVDVVVDEPAVAVEIDANLARLERMALEHGSAIGLAGRPTPVTTERIVVWTKGLAARGLQLVPVSAVVPVPPVELGAASQ